MTTKEFGILVPHVASARLVSPTTITLCKILHFVKGLVHGLGLDGNWFPTNDMSCLIQGRFGVPFPSSDACAEVDNLCAPSVTTSSDLTKHF